MDEFQGDNFLKSKYYIRKRFETMAYIFFGEKSNSDVCSSCSIGSTGSTACVISKSFRLDNLLVL